MLYCGQSNTGDFRFVAVFCDSCASAPAAPTWPRLKASTINRVGLNCRAFLDMFEINPSPCISAAPLSPLLASQVQWLFGQCLSVLQERGAEMAEFDRDADLLQMLVYY